MPNACSDAASKAHRVAKYLSACQQDIDAGRPITVREQALAQIPGLMDALEAAVEELGG